MGMNVAVISDVAITGGGPTQDFTLDGFGTPKGYMIWANIATTDGGLTADLGSSEGFSDGTNHFCDTVDADDVSTSSDTNRYMDSGSVLILWEAGSADVLLAEAQHSAFITDGIRLSWSTIPATAIRLQIVLFGGPDLQVEVGNTLFAAAQDATQDVTLTGAFQPDLVMFIGHNGALDTNSMQNNARRQLGAGDGTTEGNSGYHSRNGQALPVPRTWTWSDRVAARYANLFGPTSQAYLDTLVMLSDGFRLTQRLATLNIVTGWMALKSVSNRMLVENIASPNATGIQNIDLSLTDFKPQCVIVGLTTIAAENDFVEDGAYTLAVFDDQRQSCLSYRDEGGVGNSNTSSRYDDKAVFIETSDAAPVTLSDGQLHQFLPGRIRMNMTTANATGRRWTLIAFEANSDHNSASGAI